jgi:hypothetical protein
VIVVAEVTGFKVAAGLAHSGAWRAVALDRDDVKDKLHLLASRRSQDPGLGVRVGVGVGIVLRLDRAWKVFVHLYKFTFVQMYICKLDNE